MSQNDMIIADADGATVLADMNAAFQALASTSKGPSRPSTVYTGQLWIDDNSPSGTIWTLNLYNGSADVGIGLIDTVNDLFIPLLNPFCGATSGTNTLTASLSPAPAPAAYYPGVLYTFVAANTNTGAVTFNLDSLGARDVKKYGAVALSGGEIQAGGLYILQDDGTNLQLLNPHPTFGFGNCRLTKSGANLLLTPFNGDYLTINGVPQKIPSAGVSLAATGAAASTLYYIYAYMNSGTMTLERSATGYAVDASTGMPIKSGDATRTLVGMARTDGSSAWADSTNQRFVASYFNRRPRYVTASFSTSRTTASTSTVEINSEIRNEFLTWADAFTSHYTGHGSNNGAAGSAVVTGIGLDGTGTIISTVSMNVPATSYAMNFANGTAYETTEGYHYTTVVGLVGSNTGAWTAGTLRTAVHI